MRVVAESRSEAVPSSRRSSYPCAMRIVLLTCVLVTSACGEQSALWGDDRLRVDFATGQEVEAFEAEIRVSEDGIPSRDSVSDALRVGLDNFDDDSIFITFFDDGEPVDDPDRLRDFGPDGANLLGIFEDCAVDEVCLVTVPFELHRAPGAPAEGIIRAEATLCVGALGPTGRERVDITVRQVSLRP